MEKQNNRATWQEEKGMEAYLMKVQKMRLLQQKYMRFRRPEVLKEAIKLEREIDVLTVDFLEEIQLKKAPTLF